jgi:hypothetical protein
MCCCPAAERDGEHLAFGVLDGEADDLRRGARYLSKHYRIFGPKWLEWQTASKRWV